MICTVKELIKTQAIIQIPNGNEFFVENTSEDPLKPGDSVLVEQKNLNIFEKRIVQATPKHLVKAHVYLSELICITFPLTSMREREFDFIRFGGTLTLDDLLENRRVPGVDKRLMLIEPTEIGHKESPIIGLEAIVAKKVGVNVELIKERVRVLTTRDKVGRTGVYLNHPLAPDENIEEIFKQIVDSDPIVRRRAKI